ncbi:MAG: ParB/RepB/Spo0J family partition protein [Treponema sp.]|nr:ParB/RepB/Spo0J family partition protein [Treponema sp.]
MAKKGGLGLGLGLDALMGGSNAARAEIKESTQGHSVEKAEEKAVPVSVEKPANIPEGIEVDENGGLWLDPALLIPNPQQPRKEFDSKALEELCDSIREHGIVQPIIVEKAAEGDNYYIIAGERRTRAAKMAGLTKVPVQIRKYDEIKKLEVALIENIQRADLNPIDEALAYYNLMQMGDLKHEEVAQRVGKNRTTVTNSLRLLKLPEDMQKSLIDGQISAGHARALLSVTNPSDQRIMFGKIVGNGLNVRQAEALANEYNNGGRAAGEKSKKKKVEKKDPDIAEIEQKFMEIFGTKVVLKGSIDKGSIQIDYYSRQDLDRLYNVIARE